MIQNYPSESESHFHDVLPGVGPGGVVDESVLEQGEEDEGDTHIGPHVYRLGGNITPSSTLDKGSKENIYIPKIIRSYTQGDLLCQSPVFKTQGVLGHPD